MYGVPYTLIFSPSLRSATAKPTGERATLREFLSISAFFLLTLLIN